MRIDLVTLFPELYESFFATSLVGKAVASQLLSYRTRSPREFGIGRHRSVDDTPYGGGSGMVMRVDCLVQCLEAMDQDAPEGVRGHRILLTPQGAPLTQTRVMDLARLPALTLVCGRYEGFDERVRSFVAEEISLGDFVLAGGDVAAMALTEAVIRLIPGVLGNEASVVEESFHPDSEGLLEYPQFTRPAEFRGMGVPEVLVGGDHGKVERWRREQARARTATRRPDLLQGPKRS